MIARYSGGVTGARKAARKGAVVVVVDAYRASTTIAVLVSKGVRVLPVASVGDAEEARVDFRIGERGSAKLAGFDFGNSPTLLQSLDLPRGSKAALTTTNGTRVIEAATGAAEIFTGAFVNARAVAEEVVTVKDAQTEVVVVGCGWEGLRSTEDEAAAGAILYHLEELGLDLDHRARMVVARYKELSWESLKNNSAARRLKRLNYEEDLDFCLAENTVPVAPRLCNGAFVEGRK